MNRTRRLALLGAAGALAAGCAAPGGPGAARPAVAAGSANAAAPPASAADGALPVGIPKVTEEVPYVQTPQSVVDAMLALAGVAPGDRLVDLGSGDGRVVITAASRHGVPGLGVELDERLVALSRRLAEQAGVQALARFVAQDLFDTDLAPYTVVTLYLLPEVNLALRPRLLRMAPGTRVVSHDWDMADWLPDRSLTLPAPGKPVGLRRESQLHRWVVPAAFEGAWRGRIEGERDATLVLSVRQRFQQLDIEWRIDGAAPSGLAPAGRLQTRAEGERALLRLGRQADAPEINLRLRQGRLEASLRWAGGAPRAALLQAV
jgi:hypothetical protein